MCFLSAAGAQVPPAWPTLQYLWVAACAAQAVWALAFAFELLLPAALAIALIAGSLLKFAYELGVVYISICISISTAIKMCPCIYTSIYRCGLWHSHSNSSFQRRWPLLALQAPFLSSPMS